MYESFFRFQARPFSAAPIVSNYFPAETIEQARLTLIRAIDRAEGPGLIVGPAGVGKTLLCRVLADRFQGTFQVALLSSARITTRRGLLQNILFELGLPYRNLEEGELRLSLIDYLQPHDGCRNGVLLIVDEAHTLSLRLLEEIRMITNLVREGLPRVRLVLAGNPKLEERFASPKLESFNQRIAARCYLDHFRSEDTIEYVRSRILAVGGQPETVFTVEALRSVHQATDGIGRLINQLCDHALVMAFAGGRPQIDAAGIQEAWADLQQLPGPWRETAQRSGSTVIEFGELSDEEQPAIAAETPTGLEEVASYEALSIPVLDQFNDAPLQSIVTWNEVGDFDEVAAVIQEPVVHDPFGGDFDEEEVVIDQSVIRDVEAFAGRPRVWTPESREIASRLANATPADATLAESDLPRSATQPTVASTPASAVDVLGEQLAASMFEYTVFEGHTLVGLSLETLGETSSDDESAVNLDSEDDDIPTVRLAEHVTEPVDDRDLLVIEEDLVPSAAGSIPNAAFPARRLEYQQLLSQLRHG